MKRHQVHIAPPSKLPGFAFWGNRLLIVYGLLITACVWQNELQAQGQVSPKSALEEKVKETLKKNAEILRFMENKGQLKDKNILYYFEGKKSAVYIEKTKIRFVAKDYVIKKRKFLEDEIYLKGTHTFTLNFKGANHEPKLKLGNSFSTKYNYFLGKNARDWASSVMAAKDLILEDVYPGIDLRLYSSEDGSLEFDWILDAGADYAKIDMQLDGQDKVSVEENGSLKVGLRFTDIKFNIPESYQVTETGKVPVHFAFNTNETGKVHFTTTSKIDARYPLVIDPILTWGTFMDGNDPDFDQYLFAIQVDPVDGMVYCAGATNRQISTSAAPYDANGYLNAIAGFGVTGLPRVAMVYRINSGGSDLVDMTLFGPGTIASGEEVVAYGLSLSSNRVFICGKTDVDIPLAGSSFDGTRDIYDGFVASFSKDLGSLLYSSYLGGTGDETLGATSIRAINDNTYVVGITAMAQLPAVYITGGVADPTYSGSSEMWIGKFTNNNTLLWGTYVGGAAEETFNDLEVFSDGRIAFAGWGDNTNAGFPEVNGAATQSDLTDNTDGILGILNSNATAFNYLDEIGGPGNDRINDVELFNGNIAWTGSVSAGFPTSSGAYNQTHSGGTDVVVGLVSVTGGSSSYKATYFGGSGNDIGSGIQVVTQYNCSGTEVSFLLVFGTTAQDVVGIPTVNLKNESFFSATNSGGLDIFFAGFNENVSSLKYATNIGGIYNDYLGDTGDPRGANHLCVKGGNIYVGTTTHSAVHTPAIVGGTGFDQTKSNTANPTSDDAHVIFSIQFTAILETDYSDSPASYGAPSHILDCTHLRINTLDDGDSGPLPTGDANGDDLDNLDDENGVLTFPTLTNGGPQNISVTVTNVLNITGIPANLYAWIDLNGDGVYKSNEIQSVVVANGFNGNITLTWTSVTISGPVNAHYLRIRLTTDNLNDDVGTPNVDERAILSASDGEVEDYSMVTLNCPPLQTESACQTQSTINAKYASWLASATAGGGCNGLLTTSGSGNPSACGESRTVTFTYTGSCVPFSTTCSSVFTVTPASSVVLNCASNVIEASCQTQAIINSKYANWLATVTFSGGCNSGLSNNSTGAPSACGGSKTVTFTVTSTCEPAKTCTASFTVNNPTAVVLNCPSNVTESPCQGQAVINAKFNAWLATANASGGCNGSLSNNNTGAPDHCLGGTKTVTFTYTNSCGATQTCTASFTVTTGLPTWTLTKTSTKVPNYYVAKDDVLTYSIVVDNTGNLNISNVVVTDPDADSGTILYVSGDVNNNSILETTEVWTYTAAHTIKQTEVNAGSFTNTATVTGTPTGGVLLPASDTAVVPAIQNPAIDLIKTGSLNMNIVAPNGIANVGDRINYSFTVTNTGNVTLTNIMVTDPIISVSGGPITLAPGASNNSAFTGFYVLTQADIDAGKKDNTATVSAKDPKNNSVIDTDDETTNIPKNASIDLIKTGVLNMNFVAPNGIANVGDKINYSFTVTNTGNVTLTNITVSDPIVTVVGGPITLAPGASNNSTFTGTYTLTQADIDAGKKDNTATTTGRDPQNISVVDTDDETTIIPKNASIDLIKTGVLNMNFVSPNGVANVGDKINYSFTVTNTGNVTLTNITVTDPIVTVVGGPITLAPGASNNSAFTGTYTLTQADIDAGKKDNTAATTGKDPQNVNVTDTDDETTIIPKNASIDLIKTGVLNMNFVAPNGIANVGDKINYSFTVTNTGNVTLTNITITDPIVTVVGGPITLAPGASNNSTFTGVYTLTQADIDAGKKDNTATVTGKDPQNINVTDTDDETTIIPKNASIDLVKSGVLNMNFVSPNGIANVGDKINYSFTVTNTGNVTLSNITISDPIVTVAGGPITLAPGASNSSTFTGGVYTLTQADIDAGKKDNTATTTGKDPQNINVTDSDDETTLIPQLPKITLEKTGTWNDLNNDGFANVGETITYHFNVCNTGNVTLTNVTVTDPLVTVSGGPLAVLNVGACNSVMFTGNYIINQVDIDTGRVINVATTKGNDPKGNQVTDMSDDPNDFTNTDPDNDGDPDDPTKTNLPQHPKITLEKSGTWNDLNNNGYANVGETISYKFKVCNAGNVTLKNVTVTDPLVTVSGGPIPTLPVGVCNSNVFTGIYFITQVDIDTGRVVNVATAKGIDPKGNQVTDLSDDPNDLTNKDPDNDGDPDDTTKTNLPQYPKITIEKTGTWNDANNDGYANVGETISYQFKVCNVGNVTLKNITVTDPLVTVSGGPIPTLNVGACNSVAFTGSYIITQIDIDTGRVVNVATAKGIDPKGNPVTDLSDDPTDLTNTDPDNDGDPDDPTITILPQNPKIGAAKKLISVVNNLDGTFTAKFEISLKNNGNVTLGDIQSTDNITTEFGNFISPLPLNAGDYSLKNFAMLVNGSNPLTLNSGFNGKTDLNLFKVTSGGTIKVGESVKLGFDILFRPVKYIYYNQATVYADKPKNDDPVSLPDDDPEDAKDFSDSGSNATNNAATGGSNPGEPGDKGTVDDPTLIKIPAGQLIGTAWDDLNGNGLQDINEPVLKGVETSLYSCSGNLLLKDTTDVTGNYQFDFLETPKDYYILFKLGAYSPDYGYTFSNVGANDKIDSDADTIGRTSCLTLDLYEKDSTYDVGLIRLASTGNYVWNDKDGNGVQDITETGIQNVNVTVYNASAKTAVKSAVTNASGFYSISGLMPGDYYMKFDLPVGWIQTTPNVSNDNFDSDVDQTNGVNTTASTHLNPGEYDQTLDAGYYKCAKISGYTWLDDDMDGKFDPEEKGINGLNIYLIDAMTGAVVFTVKTAVRSGTASDDGYYHFDCVKPGMYYIKFERPANLAPDYPYQGGDPNKDSDITHENGINTTKKFTILSGDEITNIFAGFLIKSQVGDIVWIDQNLNGIQDFGEQVLPGVKVSAFNVIGNKVSESETGTDGKFMLDGLTYGNYYVKFEVPNSTYTFTKSKAGPDNVDSDVDGTYGNGSTKMFSILPGEVVPTIDAGVISQALALEWLSFEGLFNGEFIELNWVTGIEEDNDHFEVERKFENEKYFVQIDNVPAQHNTNKTSHEYQSDDFAARNPGIYYYRLKQVDKNGNYTFSKTISIRVSNDKDEMNVSIYPNPVNDLMKIELWLIEDTDLELKVYDSNGRIIHGSSTSGFRTKGKYNEIIKTHDLISGQYVLEIKTSGGVMHKRFSVLK
jgi:uncharacterized repeat protein (TIGR01451 family)